MTKTLTTTQRIRDDKVFNKYWTVVRKMTVEDFHSALRTHGEELLEHYNFNQWSGDNMFADFKFALANLLLDHENISVTRYKRLVA